ncbi:hypothetical protein MBRU_05365 [Mycolicibacterium brumae DSM 44177]|nr:hypothetical protein MBRU_05365 [Mycolicibacterium brumae DSM 44177]
MELSKTADPNGDPARGAIIVGAAIAAFSPDQQANLLSS